MTSLIYREWLLSVRRLTEIFQPIFFLLILVTIFPIAVGTDEKLLIQLAPAIIWVGILLSILLSSEKLYKNDFEDGSLEQLFLSGYGKLAGVYAKLLVQWFLHIIPIMMFTPLLLALYHIPLSTLFILNITILVGSPALVLLAMLGSSITLAISRGGLLLILIILPFYIPTLIFSVSCITNYTEGFDYIGQIAILGAIFILAITMLPFAIIAAIKVSLSEG